MGAAPDAVGAAICPHEGIRRQDPVARVTVTGQSTLKRPMYELQFSRAIPMLLDFWGYIW